MAFSPSKNRKSPDFLGSFKSYERKLFCVKLSKTSDDFWPFFITRDFWGTHVDGFFQSPAFGHGSFIIIDEWMYVYQFLLILVHSHSFLSSVFSTVINFFNYRFLPIVFAYRF